MFGYSSYLDKSMNGIKTISDGVALIQNGNATFNTINVETITSSNLTDCNLNNCTTNDPTIPQSVANKEYVDNNFCDLTTTQAIDGEKTFTSNTIINSAVYFSDLDNVLSLNKPNIYQFAEGLYFDTNNTFDNSYQFFAAGNLQLSISQYSTEIETSLNSSAQATVSNFNPICSISVLTANNH